MIVQISEALLLGLIGGLIPGPVLTAVFTQILQTNFPKSLKLIAYAMLIELGVGILSLMVLSSLGLNEKIFRSLSVIGAGVLIWLATELWKIHKLNTKEKVLFSPSKLLAVIVSNGVVWTFWITVVIPEAILLSKNLFLGDYLYVILVVLGITISTVILSYIFSRFRSVLTKPKTLPIVYKLFSITYLYFALSILYESVNFFIK